MGMAAIPVVGSIITSFLVSKAVGMVGEAIGLDEDLTNLIGGVAAVYAGGAAYSAMTAPASGAAAGAGSSVGMDLLLPAGQADLSMAGAGVTPAPSAIAPVGDLSLAGDPSAGQGLTMAGRQPASSGGMLSRDVPDLSIASQQPAAPPTGGMLTEPAGKSTADRMIEAGTVSPTTEGGTATSWTQRLFSPEKTMDLVMAGVQGYGQAGIAKEKLEYPERVAKENAAGWAAAYPGQLSIGTRTPSQGG